MHDKITTAARTILAATALAVALLAGSASGSLERAAKPWVGEWKGTGSGDNGEPFTVRFDITSKKKVTDAEVESYWVDCPDRPGLQFNGEFTKSDKFDDQRRIFFKEDFETGLGGTYTLELIGRLSDNYKTVKGFVDVDSDAIDCSGTNLFKGKNKG